MSIKVSPLQMYEPTDWSGFTTKNHLSQLYLIEEQWASDVVQRIFQINEPINMDTYLDKFQPLYLNTDDDFKWLLQGTGDKNIPLVEARMTFTGGAIASTDTPGKNYGRFYLVFAEDYFADTEMIVGNQNELYPLRILAEPIVDGTNYVYEVELFGGDPDKFVPYEELQAGTRWSKEWSPVEETLSSKGGGVNYTSPFQMVNTFTHIRIQDKRPGNMIGRPVAFAWKSADGKVHQTWTQYADYEMDRQFRQQKARLLVYATSNKAADGSYNQKGESGYYIKQGAGIKQQMESSNTAFYPVNGFSIKWLTDKLLDISINRIDQGSREFILMTGERGMVQFSEALEDYSSLYTPLQVNDRVSISGNEMEYKGQFLKFRGPQGIVITVMHDPLKDDPVRNKIKHPHGGYAESYVYDILDMGKVSNGTPNIRKVYIKNQSDIIGYESGLRNPFTPDLANNLMSHSIDGYTMHRMSICGAMVQDPTRTASLKPSILNI